MPRKTVSKQPPAAQRMTCVRLGVIGTGGMGSGHCGVIQKVGEARLTAVCDSDPATAERVGRQFGVPFFTEHRKLIAAGLCDAVTICTPHPPRPAIAVDCMKAGLHVLAEKPLSERISTAEAMVRAARKYKVVFAVVFQRRFEPVIAKAIELVKSGRLGKLCRTLLVSPEYRSQFYYDSGTWRATWQGEGGGVMMNQSPHILDVFVQLAGLPSAVFGNIATRLHRIEVEDQAEAMLKYPDGATGYMVCSTNEAGPGQMIELFGDKGKLVLRNGKLSFFRFEPSIGDHIRTSKEMWGGPKVVEEPLEIPERAVGHFDVIANFVRRLLHGEPLAAPGESGLASLELANAVMLSSFLKRWVKLPIGRKQYDAMLAKLRRTSKFVKKARDLRVTDHRNKL